MDEIEPLPTVTLARLAIDQGEMAMAEKMLMALLEKNPRDNEARSLLAALVSSADILPQASDEPESETEGVSFSAGSTARIARLRSWMEAVRLASERRSP
ncbi:MAG: hypothetical protein K8R59_13095 [Thermoanaerobaculales bacterium]|nr:hypothetical protein [Thermoanaerobaculales bacterium]